MQHYLHIYTGDGKGKTTAAMGLAARMLGHQQKVLIIQFMKQPQSGELVALKTLGATIYSAPEMHKFTYEMDEEELAAAAKEIENAIENMIVTIENTAPALIVLDELAVVLSYRLIPLDLGLRLIDHALKFGDTVVTGRGALTLNPLTEKASYISVISSVKHPFDEGLPARQGIEW